jgi:penicillin-binding protein 2
MAVALAALEKGAITPASQVFCTGEIKLGNAVFHCWKRTGHGLVDLRTGITQSCDIFFYETARRTGIDRISAMARKLGLGSRLNIDLPGEKSGLMPSRAWKLKAKGVPWQKGETLLAGIGQGYFLTTPLQLAVMTARLVNGGLAVEPRLTRQIIDADGSQASPVEVPEFAKIGVDPDRLEWIKSAMAGVVNVPGGTAYRSRIRESGFEMGGKTGTVQVRRISKAEREQGVRKNKNLAWIERDHALFVGFAPVKAPRYAVSVVIEHGGGGAAKAAPIARDILLKVQRRDPSRRGAKDGLAGGPGAPGG